VQSSVCHVWRNRNQQKTQEARWQALFSEQLMANRFGMLT
jgi:hypothetical protein